MAPKFPQKVTFIATLEIDTEGMNWKDADRQVIQALLDGDASTDDYKLSLVGSIRIEATQED